MSVTRRSIAAAGSVSTAVGLVLLTAAPGMAAVPGSTGSLQTSGSSPLGGLTSLTSTATGTVTSPLAQTLPSPLPTALTTPVPTGVPTSVPTSVPTALPSPSATPTTVPTTPSSAPPLPTSGAAPGGTDHPGSGLRTSRPPQSITKATGGSPSGTPATSSGTAGNGLGTSFSGNPMLGELSSAWTGPGTSALPAFPLIATPAGAPAPLLATAAPNVAPNVAQLAGSTRALGPTSGSLPLDAVIAAAVLVAGVGAAQIRVRRHPVG